MPTRGPQHELLEVWVGRWINEGHVVAEDASASASIITSDVYDWTPGGFFILHTAYGRIGDTGVGGTEIIGYDAASGSYRSHIFDSSGNLTTHKLTARGDEWTYHGDTARSSVVFGEGGRTPDGSA